MRFPFLTSSLNKRYAPFIAWGFVHGAITYLALVFLFQNGETTRDIAPWELCLLISVILSVIIFGILIKARYWIRSLGFVFVGLLAPYIASIVNWSLYDHEIHIVIEPLAVVLILIWTVCSLPFALLAGIIYFFVELFLGRKKPKAQSFVSAN